MKLTWVDNARQAWRWFSVQAMVLAGAILGGWIALPADLKAELPDWTPQAVGMAVLALGIVGRLVKQDGKK